MTGSATRNTDLARCLNDTLTRAGWVGKRDAGFTNTSLKVRSLGVKKRAKLLTHGPETPDSYAYENRFTLLSKMSGGEPAGAGVVWPLRHAFDAGGRASCCAL